MPSKKAALGVSPSGTLCPVITSNARLRVLLSGDVGAWRRQLLIVRCEAPKPTKPIPDFGKLLIREEGSGILNFGLGGIELLLQDVDETGDIAPEQDGKEVSWTASWKKAIRYDAFCWIESKRGQAIFRWANSLKGMRFFALRKAGARSRCPRFTARSKD